MDVHLVDGTYELFRHYFAMPSRQDADGNEVAAVVGVARSILSMIRDGATHLGVATDRVIESFRNDLWPDYKSGEGVEPELLAQFPRLEEALEAIGVTVWAMVEYEADDALASAAAAASRDPDVHRVLLCTPDKDLAQCVEADRVVLFDRRQETLRDAAGVREKFGVEPGSIPDYLALVGDSADGVPGVPGWGPKSTSTVLARYRHLESIPSEPGAWEVEVRGASRLAEALRENRSRAYLFRDLTTLRTDAVRLDSVEELRWCGPRQQLEPLSERLGVNLVRQAEALAERLASGRP